MSLKNSCFLLLPCNEYHFTDSKEPKSSPVIIIQGASSSESPIPSSESPPSFIAPHQQPTGTVSKTRPAMTKPPVPAKPAMRQTVMAPQPSAPQQQPSSGFQTRPFGPQQRSPSPQQRPPVPQQRPPIPTTKPSAKQPVPSGTPQPPSETSSKPAIPPTKPATPPGPKDIESKSK